MITIQNVAAIGEELAIAWSDGKENYIGFEKLRHACPCAHCQGEPDAMGRVVKPEVKYGIGAYKLLKFEKVGGYALHLFWGDGHNTGFYSFDLLRSDNKKPTLPCSCNKPKIKASAVGGQPGTYTSTGKILSQPLTTE